MFVYQYRYCPFIPDCIIQISESHKTDFNSRQRKTALNGESSDDM